MDDKLFIFFFLIPGIVLFLDFLLLRKREKGKRIFYIITGIVVAYILIIKLVVTFIPEVVPDLGTAISLILVWYIIQLLCLIFSVIHNLTNKKQGSN